MAEPTPPEFDQTANGSAMLPRYEFLHRVLVITGVVGLVVVVLAFIAYSLRIFFLAFAGSLIAVLLSNLSNWLDDHTRLNYRVSLTVVTLAIVVAAGLLGWTLQARIADQIDELTEAVPTSFAQVEEYLMRYEWGEWLVRRFPDWSEFAAPGEEQISRITGAASAVVNAVIEVGIIIIVGLYLAAEPRFYIMGIMHLIPKKQRDRARQIFAELNYTLWWWLIGQFLTMSIVGVLTGIGLWILGVRLALLLAVLAALLDIIPYLGPILGAVPALLVSLTQSPTLTLYVLVLYIIVQQIESYVVAPIVQRRIIRLPPVLIILAVILFWTMEGILGAFVAAPLTAFAIVLVKMIYVQDVLGDQMVSVATQH